VRFLNPNPGIAAFPVAAFLGLIIGIISLFSGCRTSNARSEREIPWGDGTAIPSQGYFSHKKKELIRCRLPRDGSPVVLDLHLHLGT
jgi:hypothetical protein